MGQLSNRLWGMGVSAYSAPERIRSYRRFQASMLNMSSCAIVASWSMEKSPSTFSTFVTPRRRSNLVWSHSAMPSPSLVASWEE